MQNKPIQKIVIVGGGTAGWMAAAMLSAQFDSTQCSIELVESQALGTIGIGESTLPPFVGMLRRLGIDEAEFVRETQATYKLGIKFSHWQQRHTQYFHPFGRLGRPVGSYDFYQCLLRARAAGEPLGLQDFSPCSVMAEQGRFFFPEQARHTPIGGANYALHVDAVRVARYLRRYAEARGVKRTQGLVEQVHRHDSGFISRVQLQSGQSIAGDFFLDCSGFNALIIGKTLGSEFIDWRRYLPCDRAIAVKTAATETIAPYTLAAAEKVGWRWKIPLRDSTGNGLVYASEFSSEREARGQLLKSLASEPVNDFKTIPFVSGHRREMWKHNCLALGLASGFLEPLEATSIHLITRGVELFLRYFPNADCHRALVREYNRKISADYEEVRDFLMLHYCATDRQDTPFWRYCRQLPMPDSLAERLELFRASGNVGQTRDELFRPSSWQSVFEGMGVRPQNHSARVNQLNLQELKQALSLDKHAIRAMVATLPKHEQSLG
ncbi:tryptophan 7-halogenase [Gilvimarinus agarilyticus]|uniref:tryptophan halogenase family protein n=1 Tax=unclassified Gilvimarinus TaxID=2642066 RepID=UPI001C08BB51|nr:MULTISPECIES: tryptophan halogenase family protein [unclassified Gilvimarinus]MBU2886545.1 tryptophan 7-halogenase [Gilvimarinus agarilyticus]MDO6571213.1 tryptophan 7-halogenase [Gilvimarinus sp. 2_MG-2023]MDO6746405.1 tryptophan 7-halogenase [Gilvimarinus sp. 1_MG-2023]